MIYVIRHGETEWNKENRLMGKYDISLNLTGIRQAYNLEKTLSNINLDFIISSPLKRAASTTKIINKNRQIPIIYDERLEERNFGELRGLNPTTLNYRDYWDYFENKQMLYGEDMKTFFKRVYLALDDIVKNYGNMNVLLVVHYGVSIPIECYFNNFIPKGPLTLLGLRNCEIRAYGPMLSKRIR